MLTPRIPPPCFGLFNAEILASEPGHVRVRFEAREEHTNPYGIVQGGLVAAMLDNCIGPAVYYAAPQRQSSTVEMKVNYLGAVRPGEKIVGEARILHQGRTTAYVEASLTREDGRLVARASATNVFLGEVAPVP